MKKNETLERARVAIAMLESISHQIDQVYTESAKGEKADILDFLGQAKRLLHMAQQRQLRSYDEEANK